MTLKISFFNIAREDLRRRVWMLALSCLGSFLSLPIAFLLSNTGILNRIERSNSVLSKAELMAQYYEDFFRTDAILTVGVVLTAGAVITAIWGFRFLYSRKMVDLYHTIPIKRERFFFILYANGLLIWLVPFLTAVGVTLILILANMAAYGALAYFGSIVGISLRLCLVAVLCYLSFYHILLVGVMLSGNAFNALFVTAIVSGGSAAFYGILQLLYSAFYDTFVSSPITWWHMIWTSPLVCPFFLMADFAETGAGALFVQISSSTYDPSWVLRIGNFFVMLLNLLVAYLLYKKRPSELAEHGVDHKKARALLRIVAGIVAGLAGSLILQGILNEDAIAWQVFGILLCGILAFGVTDIILHMNFKAFFAHKKQMAITIIASCLILFVFAFDLTGFDSRLPKKDHIKNAAIYVSHFSDDSNRYAFREDGTMYWNNDYYTAQNYENLDVLYPLLSRLTDQDHQSKVGQNTSIQVSLKTSWGPFKRQYRIHTEDLELLRPIVETEEYLKTFYPLSSGYFPYPVELRAKSRISYTECNVFDSVRIREILDAYQADFRDNCSLEKLETGIKVAYLQLYYPYELDNSTNSLRLEIYSHYHRTIDKLKAYYPDLILEKENLNLTRLHLNTELALDEIFRFPAEVLDILPKKESIVISDLEKVAATAEFAVPTYSSTAEIQTITIEEALLSEISITDPEEIAALLPYLYPGEVSYNPFGDSKDYVYLGYAEQANGLTVSCYLKQTDLPLTVPASILAFFTQAP